MNPEQNSVFRTPNCAIGDKAVNLLREKGVPFQDHIIAEEEFERFKSQYGVKTAPQIFLDGERIGGYDSLVRRFGMEVESESTTSYRPVIAVFSVAFLMAIATSTGVMGFMGISLCILATLKLMDLKSFEEAFKQYDIISPKHPFYAKAYPFLELLAGLGFLSRFVPALTGLVALFVGSVGVYSVYQAVYVQKRDLNCACVGGNSNAPLGAVSMSENVIMAAMGAWLLFS